MGRRIRVAHLDEHPAILAGLEAIVAQAPDMTVVGSVRRESELLELLATTDVDVVVTDVHHPHGDGLELTLDLKQRPQPPGVVIYTADASDSVVVAATLSGANAVVSKTCPPPELLAAIRSVAAGSRLLPRLSVQMRRAAASRLEPADHAIFAMRLAGEPLLQIGRVLGIPAAAIKHRLARIIATLEPAGSAA